MSLDIIGLIYDIGGDAESQTVTAKAGWHVNSDIELAGLDLYRVEPSTPRRLYAEPAETYCYTFDSERQAKELLGFDDE